MEPKLNSEHRPQTESTAPCDSLGAEIENWLSELARQESHIGSLLRQPAERQQADGYAATLREICQQPVTWTATASLVCTARTRLREVIGGCRAVVLTGSGSSEYAGACVAPGLGRSLGIGAYSIGAGWLLTGGAHALPPERPLLLVSLARSGDSPESAAVVAQLLAADNEVRHLAVTCNRDGRLAREFSAGGRLVPVVLDERTNDRSLVMTSSFTNMVLAAGFLGWLDRPDDYLRGAGLMAGMARALLLDNGDRLAEAAASGFGRALFLGSAARYGAAREAALKMLEMTDGRVPAIAETYLGLRHGPMSAVHGDALVVCFLSCAAARPYELDLIRELNAKGLGARKVIVGERIPPELLQPDDIAVECPGMAEAGGDGAPVIDALAGQLLAFFRCRQEGLKPDSPSASGAIRRVVGTFQIHG